MIVNGTIGEDTMLGFKGECAQFSFNQCLIYTHDGASAKFSTNAHEMDNSVQYVSFHPLCKVPKPLHLFIIYLYSNL